MEALKVDITRIASTTDHILLPKITMEIDIILQVVDRKGDVLW